MALVLGILVPDFADVLGGWITSYIFHLPNSRRNEQEADEYGVKITNFLGFNPLLALDFFEHLKKVHGDHIEYLSTHPSNDHRIENIKTEHENTRKLFLENHITRDKDLEQKANTVAKEIKNFIKKRGPPM